MCSYATASVGIDCDSVSRNAWGTGSEMADQLMASRTVSMAERMVQVGSLALAGYTGMGARSASVWSYSSSNTVKSGCQGQSPR